MYSVVVKIKKSGQKWFSSMCFVFRVCFNTLHVGTFYTNSLYFPINKFPQTNILRN